MRPQQGAGPRLTENGDEATAVEPADGQPPVPAPKPPAHILFVLEYFYPHVGGVEILFLHLTEGLARAGVRVTVVTLRVPGTAAREVRNGVEILRVRTPRWGPRYCFMLWALPLVLQRAREADLVHTTTYNAAVPAWLAARLRGKPVVITVHEVFGPQWNTLPGLNRWLGYGYRFFEWCLLHLPFAHHICDSRFTRDRLVRFMGVPGAQASVAYPALDYGFWNRTRYRARDLRAELRLPPDAFVYLYFGRPGISKGVEYLIEAAARVRERLPRARLVLLLAHDPPGPYRRIREQIDQLGLRDAVVIHDPVPRAALPGYLMGADCIVVPSVSEGFGYSAAEAALLGCPVIATSGHAVEEVLGAAVRLVPPSDAAALAEAILESATHPQVPRALVPRYDVAAHLTAVQAVYRGVLGTGGVWTDGQGAACASL
jgi:glycosyltransferase involved in cell wall biosynthesis